MPALYRFIVKPSFDGSRLSKLTLNRRNSPKFSGAYRRIRLALILKVTSSPMQTVFNTPVGTNHLVVPRRRRQTTNVEADFAVVLFHNRRRRLTMTTVVNPTH